jgi:DNA polymerase
VWEEYAHDQEINDRGVALDMTLVRNAIKTDTRSRTELTCLMKELTNLDNPNSVQQMKQWLADNGMETDSLGKKAVADLLKDAPEPLGKVLTLRQQLAKSSVKKYQTMENAVCADGRARGMFQFYGANRTGRWAGRLIQMQNLPQNHLADIEQARGLVHDGDFAALELLYDNIPDVLSQLIRTAFVPKDGYKLIVADFSAIEARVIAWLAGERWRNDVFATHGKIYEASASQMFNVPMEEVTKGSPLRQKGKIAELALGYGGSVGALKAMGALEMGLSEDELRPLVSAWRSANPIIVQFWWDVDRAAMKAVRDRTVTETHGIRFSYQSGMLFITLPSGRRLSYVKPRIGTSQFGSDCVTYEGVGGTKKWERIESYGPKFVENIVQATSRDILTYAMQTLRHCAIVMHVHDEVVIEADPRMSTEVLCQQMSRRRRGQRGFCSLPMGSIARFTKKIKCQYAKQPLLSVGSRGVSCLSKIIFRRFNMNGLQVFSYEGNEVRTVQKDDGTWWVLKDVCAVLDISNNRDAALRLDEDEKDDVGITDAIGRQQNTTVISESGLYNVILLSRKPEAKKFKRWVTMRCFPPSAGTAHMSLPRN